MDTLTPEARSENMRRIRSKDTGPERQVRALVCSLGHRGYRLHRGDLPGKPDLAWIGKKLAIFVHGCFWHGHHCKEGARMPRSNRKYWSEKIAKNRARDARHLRAMRRAGWRVLVLWECELKCPSKARARLGRFLAR